MRKLFKFLKALNKKMNSYTDDNYKFKEHGSTTNPATGLPMIGSLDSSGNSIGSSQSDYYRR